MEDNRINYTWKKVDNFDSEDMKKNLSKLNIPTVYKWSVLKNGNEIFYYVGETNNLKTRINFYLKPEKSQKTNIRINDLLNNYISKGYTVSLYIVDYGSIVRFNEVTKFNLDLDNYIHRKFLESYIILDYSIVNKEGCLNKDGRTKNVKK